MMSAQRRGSGSLYSVDAAGVAVCVLLTVLAYFGAVHPHTVAATERIAREAELATHITGARKLATSESSMSRRLEALRQTLSDDALPLDDTAKLNRRLARMGDLATECGLTIDEIRVGDAEARSHYQTVPLELKGRADFQAAVTFLNRLHDTAPDIGVWSFNLSGNPREPESPTTCAFNLTWYAAPEDRP
ncbi:MAG: hypothetical protein JSV91_11000 [Phycisphaerales bacterium]|nr:MAG: hypothetical protein JSV91_11000 [Phycisphaerales bacterium]